MCNFTNSDVVESMQTIQAILTRKSVRTFTGENVTDVQIELLLKSAMAAPSAGNEQPWEYIVIRDKSILEKIPTINQYAVFAPHAPVGILVCGNTKREKFAGFWIEDTSAATQNILLAAHSIGLGTCWTGIYPMMDRVTSFRKLVCAPEYIIPMAFIVVGHPKSNVDSKRNRFDPERIHNDVW